MNGKNIDLAVALAHLWGTFYGLHAKYKRMSEYNVREWTDMSDAINGVIKECGVPVSSYDEMFPSQKPLT